MVLERYHNLVKIYRYDVEARLKHNCRPSQEPTAPHRIDHTPASTHELFHSNARSSRSQPLPHSPLALTPNHLNKQLPHLLRRLRFPHNHIPRLRVLLHHQPHRNRRMKATNRSDRKAQIVWLRASCVLDLITSCSSLPRSGLSGSPFRRLCERLGGAGRGCRWLMHI